MSAVAAMLVCVLAAGAGDAEVSRSSPTLADVAGTSLQFQGSFELAVRPDEFPAVRGHLRAIDETGVPDVDTPFSDPGLSARFDAADGIPTAIDTGCVDAFSGACRSIFTHTEAGFRPAAVELSTSNAGVLAPVMGADAVANISRVLSGGLGGVDRSTPAVVGHSPAIGNARPTMVYVGARDGMLHAVCAEAVAPCPRAGTELWAFMPRTQLPLIASNTQAVDGSPRVDDAFGDFGTFDDATGALRSPERDGLNEFRTVLVFQTGNTAATYALDVTDPARPAILWEREQPGPGLTLAMGPARVEGATEHVTFVQTALTGPESPGFAVTAVSTITGEPRWTFSKTYRDDRRTGGALPAADAIPGGVSAVSTAGLFELDRVLVPSLYGELYVLDAGTGDNAGNRTADQPAFRFSVDGKPLGAPPAIYADAGGRFFALVVSGGFAAAGDGPTGSGEQMLVSVPLGDPVSEALDETDEALAFSRGLGPGQLGFAQATIAGNEALVVTDTDNANAPAYGAGPASGSLVRYDLSTGEPKSPAISISGGASSIDARAASHKAYIGTKGSLRSVAFVEPAFDTSGSSVELSGFSRTFRRLWLRVQ